MIIKQSEFILSGTNLSHLPKDNLPEFMLSGRSNVGKSSFINMVLNNNKMARISQNPGKTQTLNFFLVNKEFYLVDVPGYGYARVSQHQRELFGKMMEEYISKRENLKMVFLLVDFRHKPTNDDCLMYDFVKYYHIPVTIIATKKDKVKRSQYKAQEKLIKETLNLQEGDTFITTSSETKEGLLDVLKVLEDNLK